MNNPEQLSLNFEQPSLLADVPVSDKSICDKTESEKTALGRTVLEKPALDKSESISNDIVNHRETPIDPNGFTMRPPLDNQGRHLPIPYDLKVSARARQLYLRVEPGRGLQVTVPKRYPRRTIPVFVESQRAWITEALEDLDKQTPAMYRQWPPPQLHLQACGCLVDVQYEARTRGADRNRARAKWLSPTILELDVDTTNRPLVAKIIAQTLKARARDVLEPWLEACSIRSQLHYKRVVIRGQRTVWGSYSSNGTLSLNYKLLFLEPNLVDYVLLHELAHIKHLDHSAAFWRFLEALKPDALALDEQLKESGNQVPAWLELVAPAVG